MPSSPSAPLRKKLFYGWWIVLAGFCLQMLQGALLFHGFGAYILPLQGEFGWKRAEISGVFSMVRAESGLLGPLQGWLISRFGPCCIMQVGMTLFGAGFWLLAEIDSLIPCISPLPSLPWAPAWAALCPFPRPLPTGLCGGGPSPWA